jgi:hypothetical protein
MEQNNDYFKRCENGHIVSDSDKHCKECGVALSKGGGNEKTF